MRAVHHGASEKIVGCGFCCCHLSLTYITSQQACNLFSTDKAHSYLVTLLIMLKLHLFATYFLRPQYACLQPSD